MPAKLSAPQKITAVPRDSSVSVSWHEVENAGGYILRFFEQDKPQRCIKKRYATSPEKSVSGFVNNTGYSVEVTAFVCENGREYESPKSERVCFTPSSDELKAQNVLCLSVGEYANIRWQRGGKTPMARFKSSNPEVALVDGGLVRAVSKGCAEISCIAEGEEFVTEVYVDRTAPQCDAGAVLLFTGDIMCTARQQRSAQPRGYDFAPCFTYIRSTLAQADVCCGALSTACCDFMPYRYEQPRRENGTGNDNAPSVLLAALSDAGIDVLCTANSHCCGMGEPALQATADEITRLGIDNVGTLKGNPVFRRVKGFRVAYIGCNMGDSEEGHGGYTRQRFASLVKKCRAAGAEYIVALPHWGEVNSQVLNKTQLEESRYMADAGADLIVGSHPHLVQRYTVITAEDGRHVPCAYSLGNFLTSHSELPENRDSAILRVSLLRRGGEITAKISYIPCVCVGEGGDVRILPVARVFNSDSAEAKERISAQIGGMIQPYAPKPAVVLSGSSILGRIFGYSGRFATHKAAMRLSQLGTAGEPVPVDTGDIALKLDIEKGYTEYFRACCADYAAVDFYTAVTAVLYKRGDTLYTGSRRFLETDFYKQHSEEFTRISPPFTERLWKQAVKQYAEALLSVFPSERIILVRQYISDKTAFVGELRLTKSRDALNSRLAAMEDYFISLVNPCVIDLARHYFGRNDSPLHFEREYYCDASDAAMKIITGGRRYVTEQNFSYWYDRVMRYYGSMTAGSKQRWLLDMRSAADMLIAYTNLDYAAKFRTRLMQLKACGESRLDMVRGFFANDRAAERLCDAADIIYAVLAGDVSRPYDFYAPAFRENMNIVKLIAKLLSMQLSAPVSSRSAELVMLLKDSPGQLEGYLAALQSRTADIWGSDISKEIADRIPRAETGKYIFMQNPILSYEPIMPLAVPQDDAMFNGSSWRRRMTEDAFARSGLFTLSKSGAKWLVTDLQDIVSQLCEYRGCLFQVDGFFCSTEFYKSIQHGCTPCHISDKRTPQQCREAMHRFAEDMKFRYGSNIVLVRIDLKDEYIDRENRLQKLPHDPQLQYKRKLLELCEQQFIAETGCYVIDIAKRFHASDSHIGGAGAARYEQEFYRQSAEHLARIMAGDPRRLYERVDEGYIMLRDLRLGRE